VDSLWAALAPLVLGSALVPAQFIVTIMLLRAAGGRGAAVAFIAGMTTIRLVQGGVFGLAVSGSRAGDDAATAATLKSALLLVIAILLLVMAVRKLLTGEDPDAPPPAWLARTATMNARQAFLAGAALLTIAPKFWVFTLGAITAIQAAALDQLGATVAFLLFVAFAVVPLLSVVGLSMASRSDALLERLSAWLLRNNRPIVIGVGLVFGAWFLAQALTGLGVL
jgi:threonine/homoserine/homoserine lactone efflux protein